MIKEYHNICVNLMLIDQFADRNPIFSNVARSVEILRAIFIYFS